MSTHHFGALKIGMDILNLFYFILSFIHFVLLLLIFFYFILFILFFYLLLWVKQFCKSAHTNNNLITINIIECEMIKIKYINRCFWSLKTVEGIYHS